MHQPARIALGSRATAESGKSVTVTAIGLITLLMAVAYAVHGSLLIIDGALWSQRHATDPWREVASLFGLAPAILIFVGVALLPLSIMGLSAGTGVLMRRQWGRILTFIFAALAVLLGLAWVDGAGPDAIDMALGIIQIMYGVLAIVLLLGKDSEFSRITPGTR